VKVIDFFEAVINLIDFESFSSRRFNFGLVWNKRPRSIALMNRGGHFALRS
jgi:hypothetical protein